MIEGNLDGIEMLRVIRVAGNLSITGIEAAAGPLRIMSDHEPDLRREGATAEVNFDGNADSRSRRE